MNVLVTYSKGQQNQILQWYSLFNHFIFLKSLNNLCSGVCQESQSHSEHDNGEIGDIKHTKVTCY